MRKCLKRLFGIKNQEEVRAKKLESKLKDVNLIEVSVSADELRNLKSVNRLPVCKMEYLTNGQAFSGVQNAYLKIHSALIGHEYPDESMTFVRRSGS